MAGVSTQGTVEAARDAMAFGHGMNLGGGTHHAGRAAGRGYCLFNDLAVAITQLRGERPALGRWRSSTATCNQGDGTAEHLQPDPAVFTLSLHGGANYPFRRATSDLDVDLPSGTGDADYLARPRRRPRRDRRWASRNSCSSSPAPTRGRAIAWDGSRSRSRGLPAVTRWCSTRGTWGSAVTVVLAGGYAPDLADTPSDINLQTARALRRAAG